jgi:UDP-N-acetylmuramate dehydrogenase
MLCAVDIQENVPLAPLTTFEVGGPARFFVEAQSEADVRSAVEHAKSRSLPLFVLGGGSNLVVADAGFPGLVLKIALTGLKEQRQKGKVTFEVGAGEDWDSFVARAVAGECAGVECLSGIPGTVGGTPVQNVGAYGQEVKDTITSVRVLDIGSGEVKELSNAECGFRYRSTMFNTTARGRYIVLRVTFTLASGGKPHIAYADLKIMFAGRPDPPTLSETREAVRRVRLKKAMLIVPGDDDCRSAGSFFKNPILSQEKCAEVEAAAARLGQTLPRWPAEGNRVKIPAAWLVERAGFPKGTTRGPVGISRKHALAIVNRGNATAADIVALKDEVQKRVIAEFGIELQPEPVFVGFEDSGPTTGTPSSLQRGVQSWR